MPVNIEEIIERAFEQAFLKALDQTVRTKAEALFKKAFEDGTGLPKKLDEKIEKAFHRFVEGNEWLAPAFTPGGMNG